MDITLWTQLSSEFEARYDRCTKTGGRIDIGSIAPTLIEAGKALYELLNSCPVERFEFLDEIRSVPAFPLPVKLEGKNPAERYASYWLWILVGLAKSRHIELVNPELRSLFFHPMELGELLDELPIDAHLKDRHTQFDTGYIQDICLGSQQLCEIFHRVLQAKKQEFNFPDTHLGSAEICEKYGIGAQTLSTWARKAIAKGELFFDENKPLDDISLTDIVRSTKQGRPKGYPIWWVEEKRKTYQPKPKEESP